MLRQSQLATVLMEWIPDELLLSILGLLKRSDLFAVVRTSRRWKSVVSEFVPWYKELAKSTSPLIASLTPLGDCKRMLSSHIFTGMMILTNE